MATTLEAIYTADFSARYSENILNRNSSFYNDFTANIVSGSGVAYTSPDYPFANKRGLYINNLSNSDTVVVNAGGDAWTTTLDANRINSQSIFQFSVYNRSGDDITGRVNLYLNAVLLYTLNFEVSYLNAYKTFFQNVVIPNGDFTFSFEIDALPSFFVECFIGGVELEKDEGFNYTPTTYSGYVTTTLEATQTIDVPSIPSNDYETVVATLTGAELGDFVQMTYPAELITLGLVVGYPIVTDVDEISFVVHNHSGGAINPASGTYTFKIVK